MYKKYSDNKIGDFINLGNGEWEFCFNVVEEIKPMYNNIENISIRYVADVILVKNISSFEKIFENLIRDKYSINDEFSLINNYLFNNESYSQEYNNYQIHRQLLKNTVNKFIINYG